MTRFSWSSIDRLAYAKTVTDRMFTEDGHLPQKSGRLLRNSLHWVLRVFAFREHFLLKCDARLNVRTD